MINDCINQHSLFDKALRKNTQAVKKNISNLRHLVFYSIYLKNENFMSRIIEMKAISEIPHILCSNKLNKIVIAFQKKF